VLGDFLLEPDKRLLSCADAHIHLAHRPFQVLLYLIEQRDRVVSRRELLDRFWDGHDVYEVALSKCVGAIRKALDDQLENPRYIETRWAEGYRYIGSVEEQLLRREPSVIEIENKPIRSLAVLPLKHLTDDPASDYFSDGITESLMASLSRIDGLKVISRSSAFRFKGQEIDPREVGKQLCVAAVLEGSVLRDENSVRVAVRLVSTGDGRVLWASDSYERNLSDILDLQDEIARQVAAGMRFKLDGENTQQLTRRYTEDVEAYQLYLRGRFFWNKRTPEGLRKGIEHFEQAIKLDPNYALAYAGLADSYALLGLYSGGLQPKLQPKDYFPQAKAAAQKALELDDTLAEAHTSLAYARYYYDWDWAGAEAEFKRAIALNPNYATAHQWYGEYLFYMQRFDESLAQINRAHELDPFSLVINYELASPYFYMRRYDQAIKKYREAMEMDPHFPLASYYLAVCYEQKGMFDEAINTFGNEKGSASTTLGHIYAVSGRRREAQNILHVLMKAPKSPYLIARVYAGLDDKDQAFAWLEKAYEDRDERLVMLKVDQLLDSLRPDPRFQDLLRRVGLAT
jgi:TolB-like protein/Tfp pilus assembly protein PilF